MIGKTRFSVKFLGLKFLLFPSESNSASSSRRSTKSVEKEAEINGSHS